MLSKKRVIYCAIFLLVLSIGVFAVVAFRFQKMPHGTKLRDIEVDSNGIVYYLTEDGELYVGGCHKDSYGLYETGFRWGFLYGTRGILHGDDAFPVLFAENVQQVFEATDSFLYTDQSNTLFYFGTESEGNHMPVATNVVEASASGAEFVYVTNANELFHTSMDGDGFTAPKQIGSNVSKAHIIGHDVQVLDINGSYYQIIMARTAEGEFSYAAEDVSEHGIQKMESSPDGICLLKSDGELLYDLLRNIDGNTVPNRYYIKKDAAVTHIDINADRDVFFVTEEGDVERYDRGATKTVVQLERTDVVDIAAGESEVFILFADGTYIVHSTL